MLITQEEIVELAFNRSVTETRILDADINVAQWKYLRPALTNELYSDLINNPANYIDLLNWVKPALAFYVKYIAIEDLFYELSDRGGFQLTAQEANGMTDTQRTDFRRAQMVKANELMSIVVNFCVETNVEKYNRGDSLRPRIIGGLLIKRKTGQVTLNDPDVVSSVNQARVFLSGDVIYLQELINGVWTNTGTSWDV